MIFNPLPAEMLGYGFDNLGGFHPARGLGDPRRLRHLRQPQGDTQRAGPAMNYFAFWYLLGAAAIWFIGFETRGRTIGDIDRQLAPPARPAGR